MGLLGNLLKTAVDVVTTPLDILEDVINIGDESGSRTVEKIDTVLDDVVKTIDDLL